MKKVISIIAAASMMLIGTSAFAQVSVGAGYLNASSVTKVSSSTSTVPFNGFYAGIDYTYAINDVFGVTPGIYYEYAASNSTASISSISGSATTKEHYINIPVYLNAGVNFGDGLKGFVYAGPTFSYGLASSSSGSVSFLGYSLGTGESDNYASGNYGRFDVLVGGGVGVDIKNTVRLTVGYDLGMFNRNTAENASTTTNRNQLHAGVAFLF